MIKTLSRLYSDGGAGMLPLTVSFGLGVVALVLQLVFAKKFVAPRLYSSLAICLVSASLVSIAVNLGQIVNFMAMEGLEPDRLMKVWSAISAPIVAATLFVAVLAGLQLLIEIVARDQIARKSTGPGALGILVGLSTLLMCASLYLLINVWREMTNLGGDGGVARMELIESLQNSLRMGQASAGLALLVALIAVAMSVSSALSSPSS